MLSWKFKELITATCFVCRMIHKPFRWLYEAATIFTTLHESIQIILDRVMSLETKLEKSNDSIKKELIANGGSSLADAIRRIETRLIIGEHTQKALLLDDEKAIFRCDVDARNVWVNRTYARWLKCGTNELLNLNWKKFINQEELIKYSSVWHEAFKDGSEFEYRNLELTDVEGNPVLLNVSVCGIADQKNEIIGYVGQMTKVSE